MLQLKEGQNKLYTYILAMNNQELKNYIYNSIVITDIMINLT